MLSLPGDMGTYCNIGPGCSDKSTDVRDLVAVIEASHLEEEIIIRWDMRFDCTELKHNIAYYRGCISIST